MDRIVINSASRDVRFHPTPGNYEVRLPDDFEMVKSISLITAKIPFSQPLVNEHSNQIHIEVNGVTYVVTIQVCDPKTTRQLATVVESALNDTLNGVTTFGVSVDDITNRLSIYTTDGIQFSLKVPQHYMAELIGVVQNVTYMSALEDTLQTVSAVYSTNMCGVQILYLNVDHPAMNYLHSPSPGVHNSFAMLCRSGKNLADNLGEVQTFTKVYDPPLTRFDRMHIRLNDMHGNTYDFQNRNHTLMFEIESAQCKKWRDWKD
jgi:hypothetical protein